MTLKSAYNDVIKAYDTGKVDHMIQVGWVNDLDKYRQEFHIEFHKNTKLISLIRLENIPMK
ncbi:TPA: hypothetical protein PTV74_002526 [Clostridium botulinum]|uniref:hypothetical protein n=1 Tax=Clostridium botulinum TaxID=1491 RepID=UPI0001F851E4|nr:hypothetical protein [Clostridium botulinum]NFC46737.1 hypothetical protein [Clostridium botulinum]NFC94709.1 hypothetical protein [Clostridium botulinum]NFD18245.1 hypothetical protein [Clostridium botulinum]NFD26242.1 hypothetical protein [Clostridium botulinum]NFE77311.1 hypothetical protein [Clostridium botulinum]